MDTQIWYAIYGTIIGGIYGAFSHLGEVSDFDPVKWRDRDVQNLFNLWVCLSNMFQESFLTHYFLLLD